MILKYFPVGCNSFLRAIRIILSVFRIISQNENFFLVSIYKKKKMEFITRKLLIQG